jgi:hypothetical protein
MIGGTIINNLTLANNSLFTSYTDSIITSNGLLTNNSNGTMILNGVINVNSYELMTTSNLINNNIFTIGGQFIMNTSSINGGVAYANCIITNNSTGTITVLSTTGFVLSGNTGNNSTGEAFCGNFSNYGSINVLGTFGIVGLFNNYSNASFINNNTVRLFGIFTNFAGANVINNVGSWTINPVPNSTISFSNYSTFINNALLTITPVNNGYTSCGFTNQIGGTFTNIGTVTTQTSTTSAGIPIFGYLQNYGFMLNNGTISNSGLVITLAGTFNNNGSIVTTMTGAIQMVNALINNYGSFSFGFTNLAAGPSLSVSGTSVFNNYGNVFMGQTNGALNIYNANIYVDSPTAIFSNFNIIVQQTAYNTTNLPSITGAVSGMSGGSYVQTTLY